MLVPGSFAVVKGNYNHLWDRCDRYDALVKRPLKCYESLLIIARPNPIVGHFELFVIAANGDVGWISFHAARKFETSQ